MLGSKRENPRGQAAPASPQRGAPQQWAALGESCWSPKVPGLPLQQQLCRASAITNPAAHPEPREAQEEGGRQGSSQAGCLSTAAVGLHHVSIYILFYYYYLYNQRGDWDGALSGVCICVSTLYLSALYPQLCVYIYTHTSIYLAIHLFVVHAFAYCKYIFSLVAGWT